MYIQLTTFKGSIDCLTCVKVSTLRMRLENAQDRIAELEQEISAVVAIKDQMIAKNAEIKVRQYQKVYCVILL